MRKFLALVLVGLFATLASATPPPHKDPRPARIAHELSATDPFGLMPQVVGITKANLIDFFGVPSASAGCPPTGQARAFYDPNSDTFKVIDSNCNIIISGSGGSASVTWNALLNPNGNSAPNFGGTTFTFSNGIWDWGTMNVYIPGSGGFSPSVTRQIGYDTTNGNLLFSNGVANYIPLTPTSSSPTTGSLAQYSVSGNKISLLPVAANSSTGSSFLQVINTNLQIGDSWCVTSLGPPLVVDNCTPGIPINVQTTDYTLDPVNDRGSAVIANDANSMTATFNAQISTSTGFDANWFDFFLNKNTGVLNLALTGPSTFDSTGTQSEVLQTGQSCSTLTDPTGNGTAYLKCSEPRMQAGPGVTLTRSPYFLTVSATPAAPNSNGIISGCGVSWTSGLTFEVSACNYTIAGANYTTAETAITLSAADATNPRIDDIIVTSSSTVDKITGTAAANPAQPTADPTTQLVLTFATIPANSSTPVVATKIIYQNDAGSPTEFNCTSTANLNCASTNNPYGSFTHSIEATSAANTNSTTLTIGSGSVNLSQYNTLVFFIRNKASWPAAKNIQILWRNGSTNVGTSVTLSNGLYGFVQTNTTTYQQIAIPTTAFQTGVGVVTNVRFQVNGGGAAIGFYLGNIQLQAGFSGGGGSGGGNSLVLTTNSLNCVSPCNLQDSSGITWSQSVASGVTNIQAALGSRTAIDAVSYAAGGGSANAQTVTLSPAVTSLTNGLKVCWKPTAANTTTTPTLAVNGLTATTLVKVGGAALVASDLTTTAVACAIYDGTNFELQNPQTTSAAGITSINSATGPAITVVGAGSANVTTSSNTVTVTGANGPAAPNVNKISTATYTVLNSDNSWRDVFTRNGSVAVTLPKINTIGSAPFVSTRVNEASLSSCTSCATAAFAQNAGDVLVVEITATGSTNWPGVSGVPTNGAGDTFTLMAPIQVQGAGGAQRILASYYATNISASGSSAVTIHMNTSSDSFHVTVIEYAAVNFDRSGSTGGVDNTSQSVSVNVTYPQDVMVGLMVSAGVACPSGWTTRVNSGGDMAFCEQLVAGVSSNVFAIAAFGGGGGNYAIAEGGFSISSAPTFTVGWKTQFMNIGNNLVTITPTTSTIGGQTTLVIPPNTCYEVMSDGVSDYSVNGCGGIPNTATNGVMGQAVEIAGVNTSAAGADHGTSTIIATGAADAMYEVKGSIACHASTSTGTSTLTITYTDTSNTVQTAAVTATCTTLGSSSIGSVDPIFRAKASTNIQYGFAHGGTQPTVDVSVAVYQLSTQ